MTPRSSDSALIATWGSVFERYGQFFRALRRVSFGVQGRGPGVERQRRGLRCVCAASMRAGRAVLLRAGAAAELGATQLEVALRVAIPDPSLL